MNTSDGSDGPGLEAFLSAPDFISPGLLLYSDALLTH